MLFNSLIYLFFLPVVFLFFYLTGERYRWAVLLIASYVFYGYLLKPVLLLVLTLVILITFWFGRFIDRNPDRARRRMFLWIGVTANLLILVYFKYYPFLLLNLNKLLDTVAPGTSIEVPPTLVSIGLSFFIFQAISYLADIYFRMAKPEQHFGHFALYISFFPKLLQGPIERVGDLAPQLKTNYEFNYDNMRSGLLLITWGLFKKIVVADRLALYVSTVYGDVHTYTGLSLILATYLYAIQIYFDFSGYTDVAIGSARLFNINLTQNFNNPYLATSVADFWRRWHISFSRWILDYVFEPLQMKFRNWGKWGTASGLLITFILAGLWHGASWNYILFGLCHGVYLSAAFIYKPLQKKIKKRFFLQKPEILNIWQMFVTFNLISFAWIFFRANNLSDAWYIINNLFVFNSIDYSNYGLIFDYFREYILLGLGTYSFIVTVLALAIVYLVSHLSKHVLIFDLSFAYRWSIYYSLVMLIIFFGVYKGNNFVYFMF